MKTISMISVLSLLLSVGLQSVLAQTTSVPQTDDGTVLLRYHFHPNDVRKFKMVMVQNIQQEIQGQEMAW